MKDTINSRAIRITFSRSARQALQSMSVLTPRLGLTLLQLYSALKLFTGSCGWDRSVNSVELVHPRRLKGHIMHEVANDIL